MSKTFNGVRFAVAAEEDAIFKLLLGLHEENGLFHFDEAKVRGNLRMAWPEPDMHGRKRPAPALIGVIDAPDGTLAATIGLYMEQLWYSNEWWLVERWTFVHPNFRKSTHARKLIEWAKFVSDELGLDLLMGIITNNRTEGKVAMYRRLIPYVGGFFLYRTAANRALFGDVKAPAQAQAPVQ